MEFAIAQASDVTRWDEYVNRHAHASPYHLFAWRQAIEHAYHLQSHYLMALDDQNQITGILPVILIRPPLGKPTLCSLPYCDRGEALADSPAIVEQLISKANELRQKLKKSKAQITYTPVRELDTRKTEIDDIAEPYMTDNDDGLKERAMEIGRSSFEMDEFQTAYLRLKLQ